ncbi:hypothetical protein LVD15_03895 [Fulvivirga maritima]|uniref:hypothetical protein n=1 Tax=Fulvivirga maritima TaxID=2904247 RepID=UPI001F32A9BF|nr:hypothetical protein [Fulvivirga maritima]UII27578.1 hypothetical protein LVD15_03895 [Fulvivirga maritima]
MNKELKKSFIISFLYVGLGTLALLFVNSSSLIVSIILLLTIPVTFVGFGITYMEGSDSLLVILIVQILIFLTFWRMMFLILKRMAYKAKKRRQKLTEAANQSEKAS